MIHWNFKIMKKTMITNDVHVYCMIKIKLIRAYTTDDILISCIAREMEVP